MRLEERKKGFLIGGIVAGFSLVATVVGFAADLIDLGGSRKDAENSSPSSSVVVTTEAKKEPEVKAEIVETTTEKVETTTEEIVTEPPETTTEEPETTPKNPEDFYLSNISPTQDESLWDSDSETDTIGNHYTGHVQIIHNNGYAIYYIGGQYTKLTGIIAANTNGFRNDNVSSIKILVDDKEVYNTGEFSRVSTPMNVDIDITGANWLKIQHSYTSGGFNSGFGQVILADFKFAE